MDPRLLLYGVKGGVSVVIAATTSEAACFAARRLLRPEPKG